MGGRYQRPVEHSAKFPDVYIQILYSLGVLHGNNDNVPAPARKTLVQRVFNYRYFTGVIITIINRETGVCTVYYIL